jgi:hypothetical protein
MRIESDSSGLESIPLKLMIIAVIAALSIVPAANALENLEDRDFLRRAEAQLDRILATVEILGVQGPGSLRVLDLDFSSGGSLRFLELTLGDTLGGPRASSVVLTLSTGAKVVKQADDPPVEMSVGGDECLIIRSELSSIRMECVLETAHWYVCLGVHERTS